VKINFKQQPKHDCHLQMAWKA